MMSEDYSQARKCRLCHSNAVAEIFNFGDSPLANAFRDTIVTRDQEFTAPLAYFKCESCHSVQLKYEVSGEILFKDYMYETPPNLTPHFKELAATITDLVGEGKSILDIGSNNGLLLKEFQKLGHFNVCGIEPAENIADKAIADGVPTHKGFFGSSMAAIYKEVSPMADVVTCTNCFAHLDNIEDFVLGVSSVLKKDGVFVFENAYLLDTLKNKDFGQAYFEHKHMFAVSPLVSFLGNFGLELFKVEHVDVQMGSIRGYVKKSSNKQIKEDGSVGKFLIEEIKAGLLGVKVYLDFMDEIEAVRTALVAILKDHHHNGRTIAVYGWPAKMTLLASYFEITEYIDMVVEESDAKIGKFAPGTNAEIKSLEYFKENPTDVCIIGAYNYEKDIMEKNDWYGGEWINPLK